MQIEEIFQELDSQVSRFYEKAKLARETARKAHKRGNMHKRDKFHAIARVYEMVLQGIGGLCPSRFPRGKI